MGFPVRSNIFRPGSPQRRYLARYPVQVAVLFSPGDTRFADAFREVFLDLDRLTGPRVCFVSVLDPPEDWKRAASNRMWWREYQHELGEVPVGYDDRPIVREIARLFGIEWRDLPVLVVGTDLWNARALAVPANATELERQFREITRTADRWGEPTIGDLWDVLIDDEVFEPPAVSPEWMRGRLERLYGFLEQFPREPGQWANIRPRFIQMLEEEIRVIQSELQSWAQTSSDQAQLVATQDVAGLDARREDAAGRLIAAGTVLHRAKVMSDEVPVGDSMGALHGLEEESQVMVEQARCIGALLDETQRGRPELTAARTVQDFSPAAQGFWKALEVEANLSCVQAARKSRGVPMPRHFARFDPALPDERGMVQLLPRRDQDHPVFRNINGRDARSRRRAEERHRFLTLGDTVGVVRALRRNPDEEFDRVVEAAVSGVEMDGVLRSLEELQNLRNPASHTELLSHRQYRRVVEMATDSRLLGPLLALKGSLRGV